MDLGLKGKTALVMAASSGLGKGTAMELAREGARVILLSSNEDKLRAAQADIARETGNEPDFVVCDLAEPGAIGRAVRDVAQRHGGIDVLVTNAPGPRGGPFMALTDEDWHSAYQLSLLVHVQAIRAALPSMQAKGSGRILCITSSSTRQALDNLLLSNAFRLSVVGMVKTLAREVAGQGILCNVIGSGFMQTPRIDSLDQENSEKAGVSLDEWRKRQAAAIPMGRYGKPDEFGRLAAFLLSEANTYITGQVVLIDGGRTTAY